MIPDYDVLNSMWWGPESFPVIWSDTIFRNGITVFDSWISFVINPVIFRELIMDFFS